MYGYYDEPCEPNQRELDLEYIDSKPQGMRFYCPAIAIYNLTRAEARRLVRKGFRIVAEDDITLSV